MVGGLEPACGLPYLTPNPPVCRGAAEGRPPWGMCPPRRLPWPCCGPCEPPWGNTAAASPTGPSPPPPDEGARARTDPPKGIAPSCGCSPPPPPPLNRQTLVIPSHHLGMPLVMA